MKSSRMGIALALTLSISPVTAQALRANDDKKVQIRTIDRAIKGLSHLKACLQGKEPCSKLDFAVLGASLLFLRGSILALQVRLFGPENLTKEGQPGDWIPWKKKVFNVTRQADPSIWGHQLFHKHIPTQTK